jgi:hypothetical protein
MSLVYMQSNSFRTANRSGSFNKNNEFYGTLKDENANPQFRADYTRLAEVKLELRHHAPIPTKAD